MLPFSASSTPSSPQEHLSTSLNHSSDTSVLSSQLDEEAVIQPSHKFPFSIRRAHSAVDNVHAYNSGMRDTFKLEEVDALRHYILTGEGEETLLDVVAEGIDFFELEVSHTGIIGVDVIYG
ncbi:hypothetical protein PTTG_02592 [Puccinia triticina 1-1 BBBD Race 1]|uniref:Uncharacterized protein n=1 Tax=Puccinia triticina (isolate 1-1 / race 1 (BBBD)) TaxID=630390 RepID=A0A180GCW6_PUCT1|nr:hypothetical protein PTTG_02592 [Puccinia triticina 1-1 BBBD Race 1]